MEALYAGGEGAALGGGGHEGVGAKDHGKQDHATAPDVSGLGEWRVTELGVFVSTGVRKQSQ